MRCPYYRSRKLRLQIYRDCNAVRWMILPVVEVIELAQLGCIAH